MKPALYHPRSSPAQVAELVDALASGASSRKGVEVRVFSWAPRLGAKTRDHLRGLAQRVEVRDKRVRIVGSKPGELKPELLKTMRAATEEDPVSIGAPGSAPGWR